jgi:hypothetical protein
MGAAAFAIVRHSPALTLTSFRPSEQREREPESIITELNALALPRNITAAAIMDSGLLAALGPGMTLCQIRPLSLASALLPDG